MNIDYTGIRELDLIMLEDTLNRELLTIKEAHGIYVQILNFEQTIN